MANGKGSGGKGGSSKPAPTGNPGTRGATPGTIKTVPTGNKGTLTATPIKTR